MVHWHSLTKEELLDKLQTSKQGLDSKEAALRLETYGRNEIKEVFKIHPLKIFLSQFKSFLVLILVIATVISLIISHFLDAGVIFAIVLLNSFIGFTQQYRAEKSIAELKKMIVQKARVLRNNTLKEIPYTEVVPGDILILQEGDKIVADCRVIESQNLEADEAVLTGESVPIEKYDTIFDKETLLAKRSNMLYAGTLIVKGSAKAIVVETGMNTEFGKIAGMLQTIEVQQTPMQKKMDKFARQITFIVLALVIPLSILGIILGFDRLNMMLMAVSLAVSAIPEGLPAVITIGLAFSTRKMLKNNAIIRRLPAAETLGSVTVICTDKTGTITEEKMSVREIFCSNSFYTKQNDHITKNNQKLDVSKEKELLILLKTSVLCNNARFEKKELESESSQKYEIFGDPTESALVSSALDLNIDKKILAEEQPRIKEIPFSSHRMMMSIIRKDKNEKVIYSKGASSIILTHSSFEIVNQKIKKMSEARKKQLFSISERMESKGLRVLAFSYKTLNTEKDTETSQIFLGFIGMIDPPRPEVKEAILLCKKAGIKVKMITGDSPHTARAVATEVGIVGEIVSGKEIDDMDDKTLKKRIDKIAIFARATPHQKLRIVQILKLNGENVAITGDGVNDVLALKKADIGISMGKRGSDVARDVSDMVIVDDNFATIVNAVEEGRVVYDNTKKVTKFLLASNLGEILIIAYAIILLPLLGFNQALILPLLPLQILWINLITDSLPALALTKQKGEDVMKGKPRKEKSILDNIVWFIISASILAFLIETFLFHYSMSHFSIEKTRTVLMFTLVGFETFFVFSCSTNEPILKKGITQNKYLLFSILAIILLQLSLVYTPLGQAFSIVSSSEWGLYDWLFILPFSLSGLVIFEVGKYAKGKKK